MRADRETDSSKALDLATDLLSTGHVDTVTRAQAIAVARAKITDAAQNVALKPGRRSSEALATIIGILAPFGGIAIDMANQHTDAALQNRGFFGGIAAAALGGLYAFLRTWLKTAALKG